MRAAVLKGERALLYTICFDFRVRPANHQLPTLASQLSNL